MTPRDLLVAADQLMTQRHPTLRRCWQRACACLIRLACEQALEIYWRHTVPSMRGRPMRHQLLALTALAGPREATLARAAWYGLSRALHHHAYELPPTVGELRGWHRNVAALITSLEQRLRQQAA
ncbi:MAG TPA: hypothetical protein VIL44_12080 [Micromonospora sp.]